VLERNNHPSRDGAYVQATLTRAAVTGMAKDTGFQATFSGSLRGTPLFLANGPNSQGAFYAATASNNVVALDETTGAAIWTKNIGSAPTSSGAGCGDISPIGIISTPIIDAQARTIFVAGAIGTSSITGHQIHALSVDDGSERAGGWPVDVTKVTSGSTTFAPSPQNQRSALSLVNGILYVAYGGHNGDCGTYNGWVVAVSAANPMTVAGWATSGQGDAIWAAGGMASDGNGVFAITGDNHPRLTNHLDSEEVIRITGMAVADKSNQNLFYPTEWMNMDNNDADFGANSPVYIEVPDTAGGATRTYVVAITKDGTFYILDSKNLGGMGGQVARSTVATGGAMVIHTVPAAYTTATGGVYVTFTTDRGAQCPAGMPSGTVVMSVRIPAGATPTPQLAGRCVRRDRRGITAAGVAHDHHHRRQDRRHGVVHERRQADRRRRRHRPGALHEHRHLHGHQAVDRADRREGPHRRRRRRPPLLLVAALTRNFRRPEAGARCLRVPGADPHLADFEVACRWPGEGRRIIGR
jgi:hypothetical protein